MPRFLGVDLGTTFFKGAVLDLDGLTLRHVRRVPTPPPVAGLPANRCELDPAVVLAAVRTLLAELLEAAPDAEGLVVSSQMHCLVFTDDRGRPLSNVITWKDQRALDPHPSGAGTDFDVVRGRISPERQQETGREVRVGVPVVTLFWMQSRGRLADHDGAFAASLPDFVLANLCGVEPTTEATHATAHGLFHLDELRWHDGLIADLGLTGVRLPRVRPFGEAVGVAEVAGRRLTCYTPVGDMQCSLAGAGLRAGELSVNVSTGSQVSLLGEARLPGEYQTRPFFDGLWLRTVVQLPAGRSLELLANLLTEVGRGQGTPPPDPWAYIERAVDAVADTDLDVSLAFYTGPAGDRGSITNIREGNATVGHLFAAAFRRLAVEYARFARQIDPAGGWERVVFSGGLSQRFPRLRREVLAQLGGGVEHRVCSESEDALQGLLALALVCRGVAPTVAAACRMVADAGPAGDSSPSRLQPNRQVL